MSYGKIQKHQPRQHLITGKLMRVSTSKESNPKSFTSNAEEGMPVFRYGNLIKNRTDKFQTNTEKLIIHEKQQPSIITASISISSNIVSELEEEANKKLNKHCKSLDNTDWVAQYAKLRTGFNFNSPKNSEMASGRASTNSVRKIGGISNKLFFIPHSSNLQSNIPRKSAGVEEKQHQHEKFTNRIAKLNDQKDFACAEKVSKKPKPIIIPLENNS